MPVTPTYPGVYIEELPSAVRTITGVPTSITAFVGHAWKGPVDEPTTINSWADYERTFGGLWRSSSMSYAVAQFFQNGGGKAIVVRVATRTGATKAAPALIDLKAATKLEAASPGTWGRNLTAAVDYNTKDTTDTELFNLTILDDPTSTADALQRGGSGAREVFLNISHDAGSARFITTVLAQQSKLVRVNAVGAARPAATTTGPIKATNTTGSDGLATTAANATLEIVGSEANRTGIYALLNADLFNLLCIPPMTTGTGSMPTDITDVLPDTWNKAAAFCQKRRAVLLIDSPTIWTVDTVTSASTKLSDLSSSRSYAAIYFPWLQIADPLQDNSLAFLAPCGVVAGIISRTDTERGVWKAPAGIDAGVGGALGLATNGGPVTLNDADSGTLNPLGVNCIRNLPGIGHVVWGARTLEGADILASQWKYLPVRRTALYIEESLYRGTQWVVFEPNDEPLWAQIRLNVGAFMHGLFRQGAFQGQSPKEAYLVKCDKETTTQDDINRGVVNILVGFAPLKPAEFVVIQIQQLAGQIQT